MKMRNALRTVAWAVIAAAAGSLAVQTGAFAQRYRDFHGRDFRRFTFEERRAWRAGHWLHEFHNGRFGWWWVADGTWYYYPEPIFPFPTYVPEAEIVVNAPPPRNYRAPSAPSVVPQTAASWYYCDNPAGYFPYVQNCAVPWRQVPATPPPPQR